MKVSKACNTQEGQLTWTPLPRATNAGVWFAGMLMLTAAAEAGSVSVLVDTSHPVSLKPFGPEPGKPGRLLLIIFVSRGLPKTDKKKALRENRSIATLLMVCRITNRSVETSVYGV